MRDNSAAADLSVRSSTDPRQPTADDECKMQDILSTPEIREILYDPRIQKLIETLRTDPEKAQRFVGFWLQAAVKTGNIEYSFTTIFNIYSKHALVLISEHCMPVMWICAEISRN